MKTSRSKTIAAFALAAGAVLLSGCASSTLVPIKTMDTEIRPYRSVRISVESKVAQDVSKEVSQLQGEIVSRIREMKRFDEVTLAQDTTSAEGLLVRTSVIGIRRVGGGARLLLGAFAGKASISTDVQFVDAASGTVMGSYSINEKTGSSGIAGTTGDCVEKAAKAIAKLTAERFSAPTATTANKQ